MRNFFERKISSCLLTFMGRVNANDGVLFLFPKAIIALLSLIDYIGIIIFFDAKRNQVAFLFTDCTHSSFLKTHAPIPPTAHAVGFLGADFVIWFSLQCTTRCWKCFPASFCSLHYQNDISSATCRTNRSRKRHHRWRSSTARRCKSRYRRFC